MSQKPFLIIPEIDVIKIIDEKYFNDIKRNFLSNDFIYKDQQLYKDFMNIPNLKVDNITTQEFIYEYSEEVEAIDAYGIRGTSGGVEDEIFIGKRDFNFFLDYLIPGIEKGKKTYLLELKKSLINADKFKDQILLDFFSAKKIEIQTVINKAPKIEEFKKNDFNAKLEENLYEILCEINSYEQIYFPIDKIHLNLNNVQVLFLFHALSKKGIIKGLSDVELYTLVEKYFTYGKDKLPISKAYEAASKYDFSANQNSTKKKIGKNTFEKLKTEFKTLFDFLKI